MTSLVECRSEVEYAEKPVALTWDGRRLAVTAILARWRTPRAKHFRVSTEAGQIFELVYLTAAGEWHIHPIQEE
jgi:hypothetical protein